MAKESPPLLFGVILCFRCEIFFLDALKFDKGAKVQSKQLKIMSKNI